MTPSNNKSQLIACFCKAISTVATVHAAAAAAAVTFAPAVGDSFQGGRESESIYDSKQ